MSNGAGKGDKQRPCLVSEEERLLRWKYGMGELPGMTEKELLSRINQIRKETKKP